MSLWCLFVCILVLLDHIQVLNLKVCVSISNESIKANEKHQEMGREDEHYFAAKLYRLSEELNCFNFLIKSQTGRPILKVGSTNNLISTQNLIQVIICNRLIMYVTHCTLI